jgi:uncharacterized membrane protein (DUF4010 family)
MDEPRLRREIRTRAGEHFHFFEIMRLRVVSIYLALTFFLIVEFVAAGLGYEMQMPILMTVIAILAFALLISIADRWDSGN